MLQNVVHKIAFKILLCSIKSISVRWWYFEL